MKKKLVLPFVLLFAMTLALSAQTLKNSGFQQFYIGDIEAVILSDGYMTFTPVQSVAAIGIDAKLVQEQLNKKHVTDDAVNFGLNILLLKYKDRIVLFDAGVGNQEQATVGVLADNLSLIGLSPSQITDIVITHGHSDHIGGLVSDKNLVYPNATLHMTKREYDFWTKDKLDSSKNTMPKEALEGMSKEIRATLEVMKPKLNLIENGETILDCIKAEIAPGHTLGHTIYTITSKGETLVNMGDVVHIAEILFAHPEWGISFDYDFVLGVNTRINILNRMSESNNLVLGYHLPYPGIGRVEKIGKDSFDWIPAYLGSSKIK